MVVDIHSNSSDTPEVERVEIWHGPVLMVSGFICGIINAMAGGGSFITLPLLLMIGLPPQVANATNRVGITLQTLAGVITYHRHGVRPWNHMPKLLVPGLIGALVGAYAAAYLDEKLFRTVAAVFFLIMVATIFVDPKRWAHEDTPVRIRPILIPIYFLLGVYCGFLQAGIGTLLIGSLVLIGGFDVVRGNALKFALALCWTALSLALFAGLGQVRWVPGLCLAAGTMVGGIVGAKLVISKGARWVRYVVAVAAIAAVIKLLFGG